MKYFVDQKTSQKIKFVYSNNKDSLEIMKGFFDTENLPTEFGGKATLKYDHEEFSRLMIQDDVKTAKYWGLDQSSYYEAKGHLKTEVSDEPLNLASPAS